MPQYWQAVLFTRNKGSEIEAGIAKMKNGFGIPDVDFIVDEQGKRVLALWNYELVHVNEFELRRCILVGEE